LDFFQSRFVFPFNIESSSHPIPHSGSFSKWKSGSGGVDLRTTNGDGSRQRSEHELNQNISWEKVEPENRTLESEKVWSESNLVLSALFSCYQENSRLPLQLLLRKYFFQWLGLLYIALLCLITRLPEFCMGGTQVGRSGTEYSDSDGVRYGR
jgi:hypothetical protein